MRFVLCSAVSCVCLLTVTLAHAAPNGEAGFTPLFNGRDTAGWVQLDKGKWTVEGGALVCDGGGSGWLRSEKTYDNFIVRLEWQIAPNGNSGVFIRAPEKGRSSRLGFESQILDDAGKPPDKNSTGSIYDIIPPAKAANKPAGEWNTEEIVCDGPHITVTLNDEKIQDFRTDDPEINAKQDRIHKPILRHKAGYIGLQNHGACVRFRNLRIKPLMREGAVEAKK